MQPPRVRRNRRKLMLSIAALAVVLAIAAVTQRRHAPADPFTAEGGQTRARSAPRPVFGEGPPPAPSRQVQEQPSDVDSFLAQWRATLMKGDVAAHTALYAPKMERFFLKRNVSRAFVRREKERMLKEYPKFTKYDIREVKIDEQNDKRAVVTFTKDWDARGRKRFTGSERQRLVLKRSGEKWQIASEEELKVFYSRRR